MDSALAGTGCLLVPPTIVGRSGTILLRDYYAPPLSLGIDVLDFDAPGEAGCQSNLIRSVGLPAT